MAETVELKIGEKQLASIVAGAVLNGIDQEQRDTLIKAALSHLLSPEDGRYGSDSPSPIQKAFNIAIERAAHQLITKKFEEDAAIKAKIDEVITRAVADCFADKRIDDLVSKCSAAIADGWDRGRRDY